MQIEMSFLRWTCGLTLVLSGCSGGEGTLDAGLPPQDCSGLGKSQSLSQSCCLAFGIDACGAGLFCAAFDGRTEPTCYPERSRTDEQSCTADIQCVSGGCETAASKCRSTPGAICDLAIGCATAPDGTPYGCSVNESPPRCVPIGSGEPGTFCVAETDCASERCVDQSCACTTGLHLCDGACVSDTSIATCGSSCSPCFGSLYGTPTCDGKFCGLKCNPGAMLCGGDCRLCPTDPLIQSTGCSGANCVAAACVASAQLCNGKCVACKSDAYATAHSCVQDACVASACQPGFKVQAGSCIPDSIETVSQSYSGTYRGAITIAVDAMQVPHVGFPSLSMMKHAARATGSWTVEDMEQPSSYGYFWPAFAFGPSGVLHASYYSDAGGSIRHARRESSGWIAEDAAVIYSTIDGRSKVAVAPTGAVHVVYLTTFAKGFTDTGYSLRYAGLSGSTWMRSAVESDIARVFNLRLDNSGNPLIDYLPAASAALRTGSPSGTSWSFKDLPPPPNVTSDIAFDASGTPHLAQIAGNALVVATYANSMWSVQTVDSSVDPHASQGKVAIALDSAGRGRVVYPGADGHPRFAAFDGSHWIVSVIDPANQADYLAIALDTQGRTHIAYGVADSNSVLYTLKP